MPLYDYKCPRCATRWEVHKPLAALNREERCVRSPGCSAGERQVSSPRIMGDYEGYDCPVTGRRIEGRAAHRENLARTGCRVMEPGETADYERRKVSEDRDLDRAVDETVERFVEALPSAGKERLAAEITSGMTADIVRK